MSEIITALTLSRDVPEYDPPEIPQLVERPPLAKDLASMLGLVQTGSPVPLDQRATKQLAPFEQPKIRALILDRLRSGYPLKTVSQAAGVKWATWCSWRGKGKRGVEPYATFFHEVDCATAEGAIAILDDVRAASKGATDKDGIWKNQWLAGKWLLERNDPDTYVEVTKSVIAHEAAPARSINVSGMSDEDLEQLVDVLDRAPVVVEQVEEV